MKFTFLIIALASLFIACNSNKCKDFDKQILYYGQDNADEYFEKNLSYLKGNMDYPYVKTKQKVIVYQLEKLTGIKSKYTCQEYSCKITEEDIEKWYNWYLQNKEKIYFNLLEQRVCFRDSVDCNY